MTTIYLVTYGSYSDYMVDSVWDTEEGAEQRILALRDGTIERYPLNSTERPTTYIPIWRATTEGDEIVVDDKAREGEVGVYMNGWSMQGSADGRSPEHARKLLSDALALAKAERQGLT